MLRQPLVIPNSEIRTKRLALMAKGHHSESINKVLVLTLVAQNNMALGLRTKHSLVELCEAMPPINQTW